jgi:hypothetical protein
MLRKGATRKPLGRRGVGDSALENKSTLHFRVSLGCVLGNFLREVLARINIRFLSSQLSAHDCVLLLFSAAFVLVTFGGSMGKPPSLT